MDAKSYRIFVYLMLQCLVFDWATAFEIHNQCKLDSDCGKGSFCHFSLCERCIPCEQLFNRVSPVKNGCAKIEDDCGSCLPGYQAEDLTNQRRSMKCFATLVKPGFIEKPTTFLPPSNLVYGGLGLVMITILGFLVVSGVYLWIRTKGQPTDTNQTAQNGNDAQEKREFEADSLPPPYESSSHTVGLPRTSQYSYTLVLPEQDILNHAAPFEPYHNHIGFDARSVDSDADFHTVDDAPPAQDDGSGSTETIPSLWEPPSAFDDVPNDNAEQTAERTTQRNGLVRSYSFDSSARFIGINQVSHESRSDPALDGSAIAIPPGGQSYAHRHVQLSMYRPEQRIAAQPDLNGANITGWNSNLNIHQVEDQRLPCRIEDNLEPNAPQAFVFDDGSSNDEGAIGGMQANDFLTRSLHFFLTQASYDTSQMGNSGERERGSQDSGFFDHSRRRPATEELELGMAFYIKRSRQVD